MSLSEIWKILEWILTGIGVLALAGSVAVLLRSGLMDSKDKILGRDVPYVNFEVRLQGRSGAIALTAVLAVLFFLLSGVAIVDYRVLSIIRLSSVLAIAFGIITAILFLFRVRALQHGMPQDPKALFRWILDLGEGDEIRLAKPAKILVGVTMMGWAALWIVAWL